MKTATQLATRQLAITRLMDIISRQLQIYPRHSVEATSLHRARAYWQAYSRALYWATR